MDLGLTHKRVLVTGGTSGIGAAIAKAFALEKARVAVNYVVNPEQADCFAAQLGGIALSADVSDPAAVEQMFRTLDEQWGGIDILINNAGIDGARALTWESDPSLWMKVIDVNLKGAYLCAREALKRMVPAGSGVIINTTSVHEVVAWSGYSAYTASKAAVSMASKTMAQEAAPHGVRVLCIAPGAIATPINQDVWKNPAGLADLVEKIPLGRIGQTDEIARMAVVLASDVASYVTATTVFIDGGMTDYPDFARGG